MKATKRILSWLLIVCTVFGMLPAIALAADTVADGEYVIAALVDGKYYAMSNAFSNKIKGTEITVTDGRVSESDAENYKITLAKTSGGYTISNGTSYLAYASSTNMAVSVSEYYWTITAGTRGSYRIASTVTTDRGVVYRTGIYNQFGGYDTDNISDTSEYYDVELLPVGDGSSTEEPTTESEAPTEPGENPGGSLGGLLASGKYVIAANVGGTYYAMANTITNYKAAGSAIAVNDGKVYAADAVNCYITLTETENGYTIATPAGYLGYAGTSTNITMNAEPFYWTISEGLNGSYRAVPTVNNDTRARGLLFYKGAPNKFGGYALQNASAGSSQYFDLEFLPIEGEVDVQIAPGRYVIAAKVGDTYYGMLNTYEGHIDGEDITSIIEANGQIHADNAINFVLEIAKDADGYSIYNSEYYLAYTASGPTSFGASSTPAYWKVTSGVNGSYRFISTQNTAKTLSFAYATVTGNEFGAYEASSITAGNTTYYDIELIPVYGEVTEVPDFELADGTYVIAAKVDDTYYALSNSFPTSATTVTASPITVVEGKVPGVSAEGFAVEVKKTANGYTISWDGQYLIHGNTTSGLKGDTTAYEWEFVAGTNGSVRAIAPDTYGATNLRALLYTATTNRFGAYVANNASAGNSSYFDIELLPIDGEIGGGEVEIEPGYYVIAADVDGTYYGLTSAFGDGTKPGGIPVTVTDGTVLASNAAGFVVYIDESSNGYTIYNGTSFLSYPGSGTNLDISSSAYIWTVSHGENGAYHVASATSTNRGLNYRTSTYNVFGIYDESNVPKEEYYDVLLLPIVGSVSFDDHSGEGGGDDDDDVPTTGNSYVTMKIITGEGEAYLLKSGHTGVYGNAATEKGIAKQNWVDAGERVTLVIKPAEGYRVACIERDIARLIAGNGTDEGTNAGYLLDPNLNGYVYTFTVDQDGSANYFRVSFLPRQAEGGYTATQITGWTGDMTGEYVITGLEEPEHYDDNKHSTSTTYLLYGDGDTAKDDAYEAIGRKSSALQLASVGVALNANDPFLMSSLNETHLMRFEKVGTYYVIRLFGSKDNYYICARTDGAKIYTASSYENNEYALWDVSYLANGAVAIKNVGHANAGEERFLMFNHVSQNLQFRCYLADEDQASYPVLYKATNVSHRVTFSVNNAAGGTIRGNNLTSDMAIGSNSYQPKGSNMAFTVTPTIGWKIESIKVTHTVNGVETTYDVPIADAEGLLTFNYNDLSSDINIVVTFSEIGTVSFTVEYYVNNTVVVTAAISAKTPYKLQITGTVAGTDGNTYDLANLTVGETKYNLANLSFDGSSCGADIYADLNALVNVKTGSKIKAYFSTTKVNRTKTVEEITVMGAANGAHGGENIEDDDNWFTDANGMDDHGNVEQAYRVTLSVNSNEKIDEVEKGGDTDIILVLDHSNSMYPIPEGGGSDNIEYITAAVDAFSAEVLKNNNEGNNRIAVVQYDSFARAWNGSSVVKMTNYTVTSYGLSYSKCYMDSYDEVMAAFNALMYEPLEARAQGRTNTMGGLKFTELMAGIRPTNTDRDLLIIMFTDGVPTCRYATSDKTHTDTDLPYDDSDGTETSAWELLRAIEAGESLRKKVDTYKNCKSTIFNVALLNNESFDAENELVSDYIMSDVATYKWNEAKYSGYSSYVDVTGDSSKSDGTWLDTKYYIKSTPWAHKYKKLTGNVDADTLRELYEDIAYEYTAAKYVVGKITDIIPADFELTEESKTALINAGCKITENPDGTTTITTGDITANAEGETYTYDIVYKGAGYGSVHTNDEATFTYKTLKEDDTVTSFFPMPAVTVVPWTVNDRDTAQPGIPKTIDVLKNDLFEELREGGYILSDFTVTLTDENGNPVEYSDAVEQLGCGFDAVVDPVSGTVTYYTEKGGASTFYYVVSATATAPDGAVTVVTSRATRVDVLVSELDKIAQEVTDRTDLPEGVERKTDAYGNVYQMYLITLTINMFEISDGVLTDKIPSDFEFIQFAQTIEGATTIHDKTTNTITCTGITCGSQAKDMILSYYVRYIGRNGNIGTGVVPTNTEATISYHDNITDKDENREFPVPTAGIDPFTTNDVDLTEAGTTGTIDVTDNDMFTEIGTEADGYNITDVTVYITDENGNKLTDEQIAELGINLTVNEDGTISYTTTDGGVTQFYYVVESKVTVPGNNNYAEDNSKTLVSRPTLVTVYASEDVIIVVDYGLKTKVVDFVDIKDVMIDYATTPAKPLTDILHITNLAKVNADDPDYGTINNSNTDKVVFTPTTTNFNGSASYFSKLTLDNCAYTAGSATTGTYKELDADYKVIPANNLYYEFEDEFVEFPEGSVWTDIQGESDQGEGYVAEQEASEKHNIERHGYDEVYDISDQYSGGTQKGVTVTADNNEQNAYFTFSGTGFDIIGSTNRDSGVIIVELYKFDENAADGCGEKVKNIIVDTYLDNAVSYDQIPVISYQHTDKSGNPIYGTYRVKIRAFYHAIFDHNYPEKRAAVGDAQIRRTLGWAADEAFEFTAVDPDAARKTNRNTLDAAAYGQYNVYIDALRIYNPLGNSNAVTGTSDLKVPTTVDEVTTGKYVIAANANGKYYAMSNAFNNNTANTITYESGAIHALNAKDYVVTVTKTGTTCTIFNGSKYLNYVGSGTGLSASETSQITWTIEKGPKGDFVLIPSNNAERRLAFGIVNGSAKFSAYNKSLITATSSSHSGLVLIPVYEAEVIAPSADSDEGRVYAAAGERDPHFININDHLLGANDFTQDNGDLASGFVYVADTRYHDADGEGNVEAGDTINYDGVYLSNSGQFKVEEDGDKGYLVDVNGNRLTTKVSYGKIVKASDVSESMVWKATVEGDYFKLDNGGKLLGITESWGALKMYDADADTNTMWKIDQVNKGVGQQAYNDCFKNYLMYSYRSGFISGSEDDTDTTDIHGANQVQFYVKQSDGNFALSDTFSNGDEIIIYSHGTRSALTADLVWSNCRTTASPSIAVEVYVDLNAKGTPVYYFDFDENNTHLVLPMQNAYGLGVVYYDSKYESVGPEKEVYLRNEHGVAVKLENVGGADTIQVSAKVPAGKGAVELEVYNFMTGSWQSVSRIISRTEMYYSIDISVLGDSNLLILRAMVSDNEGTTDDDTMTTTLALSHVKLASGNAITTGAVVPMSYEDISKVVRLIRNDYVESEEVLAEEVALTDDISFDTSITASASISASFTFSVNKVEEYRDFYLEVEKESADGSVESYIYSLNEGDRPLVTINDPTTGEALLFRADWSSIVAKEMGDTFRATLYASKYDDSYYCSATKETSIKDFLMGKFEQAEATDVTKTMVVDMLSYGAAAQIYFGYDVENLVTADLTEAQMAYATKGIPTAVDSVKVEGSGINLSAYVTMEDRVVVNMSAIYAPTDAAYIKVCDAETGTQIAMIEAAYNAMMCRASFDGVAAKNMRKALTFTLMDGDTAVSKTITWSVESCVAQIRADKDASAERVNMANAMLTYGDSVAAYMAENG